MTQTANCPFCGHFEIDTYEIGNDSWVAGCKHCDAMGPLAPSRDLALTRWSQRSAGPAMRPAGNFLQGDTMIAKGLGSAYPAAA